MEVDILLGMWRNAKLLPLFLLEFGYLPAPLAPEAAPVTFAEVAGQVTVLLANRALFYPHVLVLSHLVILSRIYLQLWGGE